MQEAGVLDRRGADDPDVGDAIVEARSMVSRSRMPPPSWTGDLVSDFGIEDGLDRGFVLRLAGKGAVGS